MLEAAQFWQYAEDAMFSARLSKSEIEKRGLMDLAHIWAQAAIESETVLAAKACLPEAKAP